MESSNPHLKQRVREEQEWIDTNGWDSDPYEELLSQCGMTGDGGCLYVGTEYCDWDCPFESLEDPETIDDDPDPEQPFTNPNQLDLFKNEN